MVASARGMYRLVASFPMEGLTDMECLRCGSTDRLHYVSLSLDVWLTDNEPLETKRVGVQAIYCTACRFLALEPHPATIPGSALRPIREEK